MSHIYHIIATGSRGAIGCPLCCVLIIGDMAGNYIVRVYRFEKDNPRSLVGVAAICFSVLVNSPLFFRNFTKFHFFLFANNLF